MLRFCRSAKRIGTGSLKEDGIMREAPIGVFDSGVGGLSILLEIRRLLPAEDLIYLADTAHCPYGVKPLAEIRERALTVTDYLIAQGAKLVVVACNSASVAGLDHIRDVHPEIPIVGVEPAVKPAQAVTRNGKIGVLATRLTLNGSRFSMLVEKYGTGAAVYTQPAPGLVELVEAGAIDSPEAEALLREYLGPLLEKGVDTLVLGCTHYPFLRSLIYKIAGPAVTVLDTGQAVARQTAKVLESRGLIGPRVRAGKEIFYTTGLPEMVTKVIRRLWRNDAVLVRQAEV